MSRRFAAALALLALAGLPALAALPQAKASGPAIGSTWAFTGKDSKGVAWTGKIEFAKLDTSMFEPGQHYCSANLDLQDANGGGMGAATFTDFDPATRVVTIGGESDYGGSVYTAILSADGKSLKSGKWLSTERSSEEKEQNKPKRVLSEGTWSATLGAK